MKVAVIGTGYVGVVTGACLAHLGHRVTCVDADPARVAALRRGDSGIHESGLDELVHAGLAAGRLVGSEDIAAAAGGADLVMVCVGTPCRDGAIDLTAIRRCCLEVGSALRGRADFPVVAIKSTVVPGSTGTVLRADLEAGSGMTAGRDFGLAMNPEFLSQGSAVRDFLQPDRIVIGADDGAAAALLLRLYEPLPVPKLVVGLVNAEMTKYAANALQATLISFANQIASLCEKVPGADEAEVMRGVHLDRLLTASDGQPLAATRFLRGGVGFGGSCFPKDVQALSHFARQAGAPSTLLDAVLAINARRPDAALERLRDDLGELRHRTVAVLGLAFKPDTDDLRESPGLALVARLREAGAVVRAHDPLAPARLRARAALPPEVEVVATAEDALRKADAAVIATAWADYRAWDWAALGRLMRRPLLLDGRDLLAACPPPPPIAYRRLGVGPTAAREFA